MIFFTGIAVNIVGAIMLAAYALKYCFAFKEAKQMPVRMDELKAQWLSKRRWRFGLMIGGSIISCLSTFIGS